MLETILACSFGSRAQRKRAARFAAGVKKA
jgi:hypothetical protein